MRIAKGEIHRLVEDMPEEVEIEDVIHRLYLRQKLEAAEDDIREGRVVSHEEVLAETRRWFVE